MPSNAQIRTLKFMQGVSVSGGSSILNDSDTIQLLNNVSNQSTLLTYDLNVYREVILDYTLRRRTSTTTGLIERGRMRLTANPDGVGANKWILSWDNQNDEGAASGITFSLSVVGDIVTLLYTSTNLAGAAHECDFSYALTSFLV